MDVFKSETVNNCHPDHVLSVLERYWREMRGDQSMPQRDAMDPASIDGVLPYSFILERVGFGLARFRVSGQKINDMMQMETRGMPISAFFAGPARPQLSDLIERCFSEPAIARFHVTAPRKLGRGVGAKWLLLPLAGVDGIPVRLMGAMVMDGAGFTQPPKFEFDLGNPSAIDPVQNLLAVNDKGPAKRPALRLVVDNG